MTKSNRQKGFTLIEIVMVIILLGILAGVALPKFRDLSTGAHDAAIDGIFGAVNSSLSIAIANLKAVPTESGEASGSFKFDVYDSVTLTGDLSLANWSEGVDNNASDATFEVRSGKSGAGRTATVTYVVDSAGSPSLSMGATAAWL
jgi:MSHA pilin protein MshA